VIQKKLKQIKKKKDVEKQFKKMKTTEGGLSGVDNTGYDDEQLNMYIKADNMMMMVNEPEDFD
jgi:hypothetical protein